MSIGVLSLKNFRNLTDTQFDFRNPLSFIIGNNGTGKTSVLEAVYFLSLGKSFRTNRWRQLIQKEKSSFEITASFGKQSDWNHFVGVKKALDDTFVVKLNGDSVTSRSLLAEQLPVQVLAPDACNLIDGTALERRRFVDWGVFHENSAFLDSWKKSEKTLQQKNALLKGHSDVQQLRLWNKLWCDVSLEVLGYRDLYFKKLLKGIEDIAHYFQFKRELSLDLYPGWPVNRVLEELLDEGIEQEFKQGYSHYGCHRADLKIKVDGQLAKETLSRGFRKLLNVWLRLAQLNVLLKKGINKAVVLLDDLSSEMDEENRRSVYRLLSDLKVQVIASGITFDDVVRDYYPDSEIGLFHVEQHQLG